MKVKALTSFAGPITMFGGETRNITDEKVLNDLIKCGYVEAVEDAKASPPPANTDGGNNANNEDDGKANSDDDSNANNEDGNANSENDTPATPKAGQKGKRNK